MAVTSPRNTLSCYLLLALVGLTCGLAQAQDVEQRKAAILVMDNKVTAESLARKERSEAVLRAEGVPLNVNMPAIATEEHAKPRSQAATAYRAMALLIVAAKGAGLEHDKVQELVSRYDLLQHFSPAERVFIATAEPSEDARIQFSWRYESAWTLLWALGYVDELGKPDSVCDVQQAVAFLQQRSAEQFVADARLRPLPEILDQTDRVYRYHWSVVEARLNNTEPAAGLDAGVTYERHYALNWLMGYMGQEWDDVNTDT
jgi:hypothetical protein